MADVAASVSTSASLGVTTAEVGMGGEGTAGPTSLKLAELMLKAAYNDRTKDDDVTVLVRMLDPLV